MFKTSDSDCEDSDIIDQSDEEFQLNIKRKIKNKSDLLYKSSAIQILSFVEGLNQQNLENLKSPDL